MPLACHCRNPPHSSANKCADSGLEIWGLGAARVAPLVGESGRVRLGCVGFEGWHPGHGHARKNLLHLKANREITTSCVVL